MENNLHISASPHIHSGRSTTSIMRDVLIALAPAAIAGTVIFGLRSLLVIAVCVASCVLALFTESSPGIKAMIQMEVSNEQRQRN